MQLRLTDDQERVLTSDRLRKGGRISIKSGHGVGKTTLVAAIALWFKFCIRPSIVLTTAPTERQVKQLLWREIRFLHGRAGLEYKPLTMSLNMSDKEYMLGFSTDDVMQMQGFHSPNVLVIVDEANGYPEELFKAIEGWLSGGIRVVLIMIGNPVDPTGPFFTSFSDGITDTYTISCLTHPNVISGTNIIPGAVTREWVDLQRIRWGTDSPFWQSRVVGEFPTTAADLIFNLNWIEHAEQLPVTCSCRGDDISLGYDPAEYGDDEHVFVLGCRHRLHEVLSFNGIEPAQGIREVRRLKSKYKIRDRAINIDSLGAGAVIVSQLRLDGLMINRLVVSNNAKDTKQFEDSGAEYYWFCRNLVNPKSDIYIPYSFNGKQDKLKADLCTRKYLASSTGRIMLEPKRQYRTRLKRSPNHSDAFTYCYSNYSMSKTYGMILLPSVY